MKLYAQGLARRLHEQRIGKLDEVDGGPPEPPERFPWQAPPPPPSARATDNGDAAHAGDSPNLINPDHLADATTADSPRLIETDQCGDDHDDASPDGDSPKLIETDHDDAEGSSNGSNGSYRSNRKKTDRLRPRDGMNGTHVSSSRVEPASLSDNHGDQVLARSQFDPRVAHKVKPLSQAQLNAIDLLILGHSDRSAANHLGVHYTTIGKWRQYHPAFRAELARRRQEVWGGAVERFRALLNNAVEEMEKQLKDEDKHVRFRAARTMLALSRNFRPADEPADVEGVLTLEARKLNVEKHEIHPAKSLVYEDDREEALQFLMNRAREDFTLETEQLPHAQQSMEKGLLSSRL